MNIANTHSHTMYHYSDDADHLCETVDEAVESFLDTIDDEYFQQLCFAKIWLRVFVYEQKEVPRVDGQNILDRVLEQMDEDYLAEWMGPTDATDDMYEAVEEFIERIRDEYPKRVYTCPNNKHIEVDVLEWVAKNNPHWIKKIERS